MLHRMGSTSFGRKGEYSRFCCYSPNDLNADLIIAMNNTNTATHDVTHSDTHSDTQMSTQAGNQAGTTNAALNARLSHNNAWITTPQSDIWNIPAPKIWRIPSNPH